MYYYDIIVDMLSNPRTVSREMTRGDTTYAWTLVETDSIKILDLEICQMFSTITIHIDITDISATEWVKFMEETCTFHIPQSIYYMWLDSKTKPDVCQVSWTGSDVYEVPLELIQSFVNYYA